ncbi:DUF1810 domain-containing protein [Burkholderiales bacterium]
MSGLGRFIEAQAGSYATALAELRAGAKRTHWIWFVLPQLRGLGTSPMAERYGIASLAEARAYLAHPVLGPRLRECVQALLGHAGASAAQLLGEVDALKLRSCLTLFARAAPGEGLFDQALQGFFGGAPDALTLRLLGGADAL